MTPDDTVAAGKVRDGMIPDEVFANNPTSDDSIDRSFIEPASATHWTRWGKRLFDIAAASILILILSPLMLLIALLVRTTSPGPAFFRQTRGGRTGRNFRPFKFRTMRGDRTPDPLEIVPLHHSEITGVGRFLRRYKLDELPQLFNVLKGEMSMVGPRPTLPDQIAAYDPFRRQRLLVRPGITGLAQVYSNAAESWEERILYDIAYVRRCRLTLDLHIVMRTVLTVVMGEQRTRRPFSETTFARFVRIPPGFSK